MTVSSITPVNNYLGDGSNKTFDFDFPIENKSELIVTKIKNDNTRVILTCDLDYEIDVITDNDNNFVSFGQNITFPISSSSYGILNNDEKISLALSLPIEQQKEMKNSNKLNLSTLEWCLDYLTRLIQILNRKVERAVKVQESTTIDIDDLMDKVQKVVSNESNISSVASNTSVISTVAGNITNINTVKNDLTNIDLVAADLTNINNAISYANNSNVWAEGSDSDVQALGGVHSAKTWASLSTNANVDLSNLSQTGQAVLNGKADVDLTNINDTGSSKVASWAMPSDTYESLTLGASGTTYTAPANGYYFLNKIAGSDWYYIRIAKEGYYDIIDSDYRTTPLTILFPVKKGDVVKVDYNATGTTQAFRFFYAVGSESEA